MRRVYATGKRKTSVAKVWLQPGSGKITINGMSLDAWLGGLEAKKKRVLQPLHISVDITAKVRGGGISGQADAVRHGIAKALNIYDNEFRKLLKPAGLLTRDSRVVERKKYGKKKARRSPQFSKR